MHHVNSLDTGRRLSVVEKGTWTQREATVTSLTAYRLNWHLLSPLSTVFDCALKCDQNIITQADRQTDRQQAISSSSAILWWSGNTSPVDGEDYRVEMIFSHS